MGPAWRAHVSSVEVLELFNRMRLAHSLRAHAYRGMTVEDIAAVFANVKTFKPVHRYRG